MTHSSAIGISYIAGKQAVTAPYEMAAEILIKEFAKR